MAKTVLVTGASGFIGRETFQALTQAGWRVICGIRQLPAVGQYNDTRFLDLDHPANILLLESELHCDAIVHLGARINLSDEAETDLFVPNVLATGCLARLAKIWNSQFLFSSTAIVYGARTKRIHKNSPLNADTAYGRSKLLAEQLLTASGANHCILRIAGVFGLDGPTHLGLNRSIKNAMQGIPSIQIGKGKALRNYVYVKDVAKTIVYALEAKLQGTHLVASHEVMPISSMLQTIHAVFLPNIPPSIEGGPETLDQIVTPSPDLPQTRSFLESINDIREGMNL